MISLLINLVLAATSIALFLQFLSNKKQAELQSRNYQEQLKTEIDKRTEIESHNQQENNGSDVKSAVNSLVVEVENLRKEKDQELQNRLEAEKQIDLALQKTADVQKRIDDWKIIQEANLKDATDAISQVGNDLYDRLIEDYRQESETIRNKVDDTVKNISDYLEKIVKQVQFLNVHNVDSGGAVNAAISINSEAININNISRNLEDILKSAHLQPSIDYFMNHTLPEEVKKSVLCETMITLDKESAIIVDIKAAKYFLELFSGRAREDDDVEEIFQQKMDRYLVYLTNPKYRSNVINYFAKQNVISSNVNSTLVMLVPSEKEAIEFENLGDQYLQTLQDNNISLHSLKSFSDLVLGE
jgi:hypothetical protein